jgi:DNA-binding CsgD family transcriptional regulator
MRVSVEIVNKGDLTKRESEVFRLVCCGYPDKTISQKLGISIKTLEHHIESIYGKIGVQHRQMNARCLSIASAVARGMIRLSMRALCLVLVFQSAVGVEDAVRVTNVRIARPIVSRGRFD